jgi:uncharacterized membrane protein YeaQ/YmgE (transglycosylase-associated protein family)
MWKTFVASPLAGGLSAVLGWLGALLFEGSMSEAEFANLRFGWPGAIVGGIAMSCVLALLVSGSMIEPLMTVTTASIGAALLWNIREFPSSTTDLRDGTTIGYWFAVSMMVAVLFLSLMTLRAARESTNRARS